MTRAELLVTLRPALADPPVAVTLDVPVSSLPTFEEEIRRLGLHLRQVAPPAFRYLVWRPACT
jgi:hypothetical protein